MAKNNTNIPQVYKIKTNKNIPLGLSINVPEQDKTYNMTCAPSEDRSGLPIHPVWSESSLPA